MDELNPTAADLQWPSSLSRGTSSCAKGPTRVGLNGLIFVASDGAKAVGGVLIKPGMSLE